MPKHTVREGRLSRFTAESKFEQTNCKIFAAEAVSEGLKLRHLVAGHRVLPDLSVGTLRSDLHQERELKNAFRL